ncbi:hypothetical protein DYBT9623_00461 [Dyadobacter sp. CECT 9623]|uniref:Uncharacterized protein n=1 Tax=Dyadobacter linearis TaxID=2823330 RepID=A0ABM8UJS3_9BACT|nr:hypothetical protein DYBT9623_00461 [Dyadobacter sp. CECT 9623]
MGFTDKKNFSNAEVGISVIQPAAIIIYSFYSVLLFVVTSAKSRVKPAVHGAVCTPHINKKRYRQRKARQYRKFLANSMVTSSDVNTRCY